MVITIILIGLMAGILSGMMGVGGGLILIPAMVLLLGIGQHAAQGISLLVIVPTALAGVWRLNKEKLVDFKIAFQLAIGAVIGALISANLIQSLSSATLKTVFGLFIIAVGIRTVLTARQSKLKVRAREHPDQD
ncbi:hypothetical protein SDC9_173021 [bioreactor metagenome]|jgi:uncharacterized membrane protein YfcA|uniref:Membrane transporter protein YfcA n=1 Tax=bioreactor metagenome TaxID=1076179 RepID=A0A645GII2_9ZZZZ